MRILQYILLTCGMHSLQFQHNVHHLKRQQGSGWTTSMFQTLGRYTTSRHSTSYSIIFGQKAQQRPNICTEVTY